MRFFVGRLTAVIAVVFAAMIATPGTSWAKCDQTMAWNEVTGECRLPPPPPAWYVAPPAYAPSFAGPDVPPPPPRPWWSPNAPMWSVGFHQWGAYFNGVWVPY
ncbi:hypothetical protein AWC29_17760 [Mycobacterium triplex]|uniref:Secreted protein antigen n=1 Tax=Mycobacterium triplex TaxID=47839 RepID=A0A024K4S0_9MYCO|nr:hypothetical protein [Mycobacterium triplex]ORX03477.1 hypothetical protein AWC29_17760 [Mycobacterium triplex]CDO90809.1 hypothetical protein BN973_05209 [Mycobacterium triplex]